MKKLLLALVILISAPVAMLAQGSHEYSPLFEKTVNYKNWTLNELATNKPVSLRSLMQGKKLVMVLYFAPWCPNWRNEAPVAASLYEKYKAQGFEIIGVGEYGSRDDVKNYFGQTARLSEVMESESREDRDKTPHYAYRQLTGDTRSGARPGTFFSIRPSVIKTATC
jgi:thiol-disulfide isomerase/thioredoxin